MHEQQVHHKPHACPDCRLRYATPEELAFHINSGHCRQSRTCYICGQLFKNPKSLKEHLIEFHRGVESAAPSTSVAREIEFHLAKVEENKRIDQVLATFLFLILLYKNSLYFTITLRPLAFLDQSLSQNLNLSPNQNINLYLRLRLSPQWSRLTYNHKLSVLSWSKMKDTPSMWLKLTFRDQRNLTSISCLDNQGIHQKCKTCKCHQFQAAK